MAKLTKSELQEKVDELGSLLFEAVHLLRTEESYGDEEREQLVAEFLVRCQLEGFA